MKNRVVLTLTGPEFVQSAVEISKKASFGTISKLYVYNLTSDAFSALQTALTKLRNYFTKDGVVVISTPQNLATNATSVLRAAAGVPVNISAPTFQGWGAIKSNKAAMAQMQIQMNDRQQASSIRTQTGAEARKSQMQRWQINSDIQSKIHEITANVTVNKAKTAHKAFEKIRAYIRS